MFTSPTLRGVARELLSPLADTIVEHLGGEPAGTFARVSGRLAEALRERADLGRRVLGLNATNEELRASNDQLADQLLAAGEAATKGERAMLDGIAAIDMWRMRAETAEAALADGEVACWGLADAADRINDAYSCKDEADRNREPSWSVHALYRHPPKPVAIGVEDDRWAVIAANGWQFLPINGDREVDNREQALRMAIGKRELVRLVPDDAPVVDVAAIRRALAKLEQLDGDDTAPAIAAIRAAIGEKVG